MKRGIFHLCVGLTVMLSACHDTETHVVAESIHQTLPDPVIISTTPSPAPTVSATPAPTATPVASTASLAATLGIAPDQDLRRFDSPVVHQFGGTCSTFATAAVINNVLRSKGLHLEVSEQHLWSTYRTFNYSDAIEAASTNFLTEEKYWTIDGDQSADYLDHAAIRITDSKDYQSSLENALKSLAAGHPVVMAIQVPRDLSNCEKYISANSDRTHGAHVLAAVGYHLDDQVAGGGYFIVKNSWGPDCGDHGYQYYPFALCKRGDLYCYFIGVNDVEIRSSTKANYLK